MAKKTDKNKAEYDEALKVLKCLGKIQGVKKKVCSLKTHRLRVDLSSEEQIAAGKLLSQQIDRFVDLEKKLKIMWHSLQ